MHEVGLVLEQFVDTLDDVPFSEHDLVPHGHELILHVGLEAMHEMDALVEEMLEECLLDVASVGEHLPIEFPGEHLPHSVVPVVDVRPCKTECYHLSGIVAKKVQLEAVAPTHGALPVPGQALEDLVEIAPDVVAHRNHCTVDKGNARAFAEGIEFHEHHHLEENAGHEFHKAIIGNGIRKFPPELSTDTAEVVLLEVSVSTEMVAYQDCHNLTLG